MPNLSATRNYADSQSPVQSDFDAFIDDIEILINTIKLDDSNFQAGGLTASTKLIDSSVSSGNIRNNNITTAKIADGAVNTSAIADAAVTTAKIANAAVTETQTSELAGYLTEGFVQMFHTFDGTVSYPRGWMLCNGDVVNETNYDAIHGAGAYATDGVASSSLLNKNLPDMDGRYPVGVADTTKDGSSAIAFVGNSGHEIDLSHTHEVSHSHRVGITDTRKFNNFLTFNPAEDPFLKIVDLNDTEIRTDVFTETSGSALSSTFSIQPESVETLFIMKVI